jgi:hypothetical protein
VCLTDYDVGADLITPLRDVTSAATSERIGAIV